MRKLFTALLLAACSLHANPTYLGVTSTVAENRGIIAVNDPIDGHPYIAAFGLDSAQGLYRRCFLLLVDVKTGESEQFYYPDEKTGNGSIFHLLRARSGKIYTTIGDAQRSDFLEFDISKKAWSFQAEVKGMAMSFTEAPDGRIYYATYPESLLYEYNPQTGENRLIARLDPHEMYPFHLAVGDDGWVYAGIGTARSNLIAVHPAEGKVRNLLDQSQRKTASGEVIRGADGRVYGQAERGKTAADNPWYLLEAGAASQLEQGFSPERAEPSNIHFHRSVRDFPQGGRIVSFSMPAAVALVEEADGKRHTISLDYKSGGSRNTVITLGPDGNIYGNTNHPVWFFKFDPRTETFTGIGHLGASLLTNMVWWENKIVGGGYPDGGLYVYDPALPWNPAGRGIAEQSVNPRRLIQFDAVRRPRVTRLLNDGNTVVIGGFPGYGFSSGGIALYNLKDNTHKVWSLEDKFPGQSAFVIRQMQDGLLAVGTSSHTVGGGHRLTDKAYFFLLDPGTLEVIFDTPMAAEEIRALDIMPDGRIALIGTQKDRSKIFVFDPKQKKIVSERDITQYGMPVSGGHSLVKDPDNGDLYALLSGSIAKVMPNGALEPLLQTEDNIYAGSAFIDDEIYYMVEARLMKFRVKAAKKDD